jgi:hypothetical protein
MISSSTKARCEYETQAYVEVRIHIHILLFQPLFSTKQYLELSSQEKVTAKSITNLETLHSFLTNSSASS